MQIILSRPCYLYCTTTRAIATAVCVKKLKNIIIYFLRGQSPADAEFNFLEVAKNLDLYGVDLHFAKVHKCFFIMLKNEQPNLPIIIDTSLTLKAGFH